MNVELKKCFAFSGHQIISVIGSGGKTSLIKHLSKAFPMEKILVSTTTKILMPKKGEYGKAVVVGDKLTIDSVEKLQMPKDKNFIKSFAQYDKVFLESDGSKGYPLKGWADDEPVILAETTITIAMLPLTVIGKQANEKNIHRLHLWLKCCHLQKGALISEEALVKMIVAENGLLHKTRGEVILFFNQVESQEQLESAKKIIELLPERHKRKISKVIAGSVFENKGEILYSM